MKSICGYEFDRKSALLDTLYDRMETIPNITILVVEDSPEIRALIVLTLRIEGYNVLQATSGKEAVDLAMSKQPDLILMDIMLPGMPGDEAARTIRAHPSTKSISIIFVSARTDITSVVEALEIGDDFIGKPFAVPELIARIQSTVRRVLRERQYQAFNREETQKDSNGERKYVFLCHASEDKEAIRDLDRSLTSAGITTWLDEKELLAGQNWDLEVQRALRTSAIALICISNLSCKKRGYMQKEIKIALDVLDELPEDDVFIIPVLIDECETDNLPQRLKSLHAIKMYEDHGLERLVKGIKHHLRKIVTEH